MRVADNITESVCFLCVRKNGQAGYTHGGTAFFLSVPFDDADLDKGGFPYLVTAKHCIEFAKQFGPLFVRLNTREGGAEYHEVTGEWIYGDNHGADVAVLPFSALPVLQPFQLRAIPTSMAATESVIEENDIGIGDEVVVTGLFTKRSGTHKNLPIVRSGIISAMPAEMLVGRYLEHYSAYLVEMRSIGGLSGSPVLVYKEWVKDPIKKTPNLGIPYLTTRIFLLGLIRGHWDDEDTKDSWKDFGGKESAVNMGIATVTPIQEALAIINKEDLVRQRRGQLPEQPLSSRLT